MKTEATKENWNEQLKELRGKFDTSIPSIAEPPCKVCIYFRPRYVTQNNGLVNGIVCCTKSTMYNDFTCYEPTR